MIVHNSPKRRVEPEDYAHCQMLTDHHNISPSAGMRLLSCSIKGTNTTLIGRSEPLFGILAKVSESYMPRFPALFVSNLVPFESSEIRTNRIPLGNQVPGTATSQTKKRSYLAIGTKREVHYQMSLMSGQKSDISGSLGTDLTGSR